MPSAYSRETMNLPPLGPAPGVIGQTIGAEGGYTIH